ncbi:MAG: hypothetical protein HOO67_05105 [Candidatus Peribacteraceae bacterium]|nr:hypothetical protein [Candidatus Peribacteraceae bacterium]
MQKPSLDRSQLSIGDEIEVVADTKLFKVQKDLAAVDLVPLQQGNMLKVVYWEDGNFVAKTSLKTGEDVYVLLSKACDRSDALRLKKQAA